jgi:hypothetical protein
MNFEKLLLANSNLVSVEEDINQEGEEKKEQGKKKKIQSYVKNRDTLYIEPPDRVKKPIEISKNLIEPKIEKNVIDLGIQSDEINYVDKTKVRLSLISHFYNKKLEKMPRPKSKMESYLNSIGMLSRLSR